MSRQDGIIQMIDGENPIYPRTKGEAVFLDGDITKTVDKELSNLRQEVDVIYPELVDPVELELNWTDNRLLRNNGAVIVISEGAAQYNRCAATEKVDCTNYQGKTLHITYGVVTGDITEFIFYNGNAGITASYVEFSASGTNDVVIPDNATSFRLGVFVATNGGNLSASKAATSAIINEFLLVKKSDIADNLTTDDAKKVLSAKQGKILKDALDVVQEDVNAIISNVGDSISLPIVWNDHQLLRNNGSVTTFSDTSDARYNRVACSSQIPCSDLHGKTLLISHGGTGTGPTMIIFYNVNTGLTDTYAEYTGEGTEKVEVPSNATSLRIGVYCSEDSLLEGSKAAAKVEYKEFSILKESDIADNLTTDDAKKVLSAKQGKILGEKVDEIYESIKEVHSFSFVWEDNKLLRNNGVIVNVDSGSYYNRCSTSQPVPCNDFVGREMTLTYGTNGPSYLAFYDVSSHLIGTEYIILPSGGTTKLTILAGAATFRIGVVGNTTNDLPTQKSAVSASVVVDKSNTVDTGKVYSPQRIGAMKYALPTDFDLPQLLFFGQSFAQGGSSKVVDTEEIPNCLMFGNTVKAITGNAFNPLQLKTDTTEPYEFPVVSCANALCNMYRRFGHDIQIVASTGGASGTSIHTLIESYLINITNMHTNMYATAQAMNKSVGCFAIVFMQGESDYGGRTDSTPDKDAYKAYLMQVKNALQQSAMNNLHQTRKPLFFIYQTSGGWVRNYEGIDNEALGVSMAQLEFAAENDDVILISPAYQVTTYTDSHPSSNGYRWLGEYYAKAIWQTLYRGFRYKNPRVMDYKVEAKKITLYVSDCVLPLMKNTWTLPQQTNYGFSVKADGVSVGIGGVDIIDNAIVLNLNTDISSATTIKIAYGGVGVGKGNICDSDTWGTWWQYLSDANDTGYDGNRVIGQSPTAEGGGSLVGKDYPMNNFLCLFYKEITQ